MIGIALNDLGWELAAVNDLFENFKRSRHLTKSLLSFYEFGCVFCNEFVERNKEYVRFLLWKCRKVSFVKWKSWYFVLNKNMVNSKMSLNVFKIWPFVNLTRALNGNQ